MINKIICDGISIKVATVGESREQTEQPVGDGSEGDHCCVDLKIVCIVESDFIQHAPNSNLKIKQKTIYIQVDLRHIYIYRIYVAHNN